MFAIRLRRKDEASHEGIYGDTGTGKTQKIIQRLMQIEQRGEVAVVWDADRVFAPLFHNERRGDWLLDPGLADCPYWPIAEEVENEADAIMLATCQFPDNPNLKDPYWQQAARGVYSYMLAYAQPRPDTARMGFLMSHDHMIDDIVKETEYRTILTDKAPQLRSSVIAHLNLAAQPLRMMPAKAEGTRRFTIREWVRRRDGWLFITSKASHADALRPLHSMWIASLIQRVIDMGRQKHLPRIHFIIDEASSLTLQEFHTALVRLRKTDCPVVYAIQNYADLEATYGARAKTIFSQPYTKTILRTGEPKSAEMLADTIGKSRYRVLEETVARTGFGKRQVSRRWHEHEKYDVSPDDIKNLPDLAAYLLQPEIVCPIRLPVLDLSGRAKVLKERVIPPMQNRPLEPMPVASAPQLRPAIGLRPASQGTLPLESGNC